MSLITVLRKWVRMLAPAFVAPLPAVPCIKPRLTGGESACYDDAPGRVLSCFAGGSRIPHEGARKEVTVEFRESYCETHRERIIVQALREGALRMM